MAISEYAKMQARSKHAAGRVAYAWLLGHTAQGQSSPQYRYGPTFHTDGTYLWSYDHIVGVTDERGKVAYDCHYSLTTTKQLRPARAMADILVPCESCASERVRRSAGRLAVNR